MNTSQITVKHVQPVDQKASYMLQYAKNALQELLKNIFICFYNMKNYNNNKILVGKRGNNKEIDG